MRAACEGAHVSRFAAYDWRQRDQGFRAQWDEALQDGIDVLEGEARRRALGGSDRLLEFLLRGQRPDVYRDPPAQQNVLVNQNQSRGMTLADIMSGVKALPEEEPAEVEDSV